MRKRNLGIIAGVLTLMAVESGITAKGVSQNMVVETIDTSITETTEETTEEPVEGIENAELKMFIGSELLSVKVKTEEEKKKEEYDKVLDKELKAMKDGEGYSYKIPKEWRSEFKSYMRYTAVTSTTSAQFKLLNSKDAYTDSDGLRKYRGRYCIAMGSGFANKIGTKIDLVLENGTILQCILGDQKADCDTTKNNMCCKSNGSIAEFIVDYNVFLGKKDSSGTVNWVDGFDGKISKVIVYNGKNGSEEITDTTSSSTSEKDKNKKKSTSKKKTSNKKKTDTKKKEVEEKEDVEVTAEVVTTEAEVTTEVSTEVVTEEVATEGVSLEEVLPMEEGVSGM